MLRIDPSRTNPDSALEDTTGIYVRAIDPRTERWGSYDLATLDTDSLKEFLEDKDVRYLMDIIGILLGHGHLREV